MIADTYAFWDLILICKLGYCSELVYIGFSKWKTKKKIGEEWSSYILWVMPRFCWLTEKRKIKVKKTITCKTPSYEAEEFIV